MQNYKLEKYSESIIKCEFLVDLQLSLELTHLIFDQCNDLMVGPYCIIWIMNKKLTPDTNVMDAFADAKRSERIVAEGFCLGNPALFHLANFYFKVKRPTINSKAFHTEDEAILWALSQ